MTPDPILALVHWQLTESPAAINEHRGRDIGSLRELYDHIFNDPYQTDEAC